MRRELLTGTVTSLLLKPCKHCPILVTSFKLAKSLYSRPTPLKRTNILAPLLQVIWITEFMRMNLQHMLAFFFSNVYSSYHFQFSFNTQNIPFVHHCHHVIPLPVHLLQKQKSRWQLYKQNEILLESLLFWDVTQRRLSVTDFSE